MAVWWRCVRFSLIKVTPSSLSVLYSLYKEDIPTSLGLWQSLSIPVTNILVQQFTEVGLVLVHNFY